MGWLIFLRVVLSVSANAVQKRLLLDRAGVYQTWVLSYALMLPPAAAFAAWKCAGADGTFWLNIALGGALDAVGNLAMIAALRVTDVSVFGPLNALRPILALLFGWAFLGETPTAVGLMGVAVTVIGGIILLSDDDGKAKVSFSALMQPLILRVAGLSLGVIGAVFLKRAAARTSAELTVAAWIAFGLIVLCLATLRKSYLSSAAAAVKRQLISTRDSPTRNCSDSTVTTAPLNRYGKSDGPHSVALSAWQHAPWLTVHAAVFLAMQWMTIRIFQETLLAYSFVYFQLGMVLQVFVGRIFFRERAFIRRLFASIVMAVGSVLVLWKG
jgi:drug/metabolite transporter (DMT)-like permease